MNYKNLEDWETICLDTTCIIGRLLAAKGINSPDIVFLKNLLNYLATTKTKQGKQRKFVISSVTLSEILSKQDSSEVKDSKIYSALRAKNVEFAPFDNDIAFHMVNKYHSVLSKNSLNTLASNMGFKSHHFINAREHISRDLMILGTSDYRNCDVIISADYKTLYPLSKEIDVFCALSYSRFFTTNKNENLFFSYDRRVADAEFGYI